MGVNWRGILSIIIIVAIVALILFSPKGQSLHGNYTSKYTKPLGSFISGFASKLGGNRTSSAGSTETGKLEIQLTNIDITDLKDVEFDIRGNSVSCDMNYEVVNFLDTEFKIDDPVARVKLDQFTGTVSFFSNRNMKIAGKAGSVRVNDLSFSKPSSELMFVGEPDNFYLSDVSEKKIVFNDVDGSLSWSGLKGVPALLRDDHLELKNFKGSIVGENGTVDIYGTVDSISLNGVAISKS
jgi:hypothetical protein